MHERSVNNRLNKLTDYNIAVCTHWIMCVSPGKSLNANELSPGTVCICYALQMIKLRLLKNLHKTHMESAFVNVGFSGIVHLLFYSFIWNCLIDAGRREN